MARIAHIAVKVEDIEQSAQFYEKALGFVPTVKSRSENRARGSFSDGEINLTLLRYDSENTAMAQVSGRGPCIHHFAIEVEDIVAAFQADDEGIPHIMFLQLQFHPRRRCGLPDVSLSQIGLGNCAVRT